MQETIEQKPRQAQQVEIKFQPCGSCEKDEIKQGRKWAKQCGMKLKIKDGYKRF